MLDKTLSKTNLFASKPLSRKLFNPKHPLIILAQDIP